MNESEKLFSCSIKGCDMTFTNEDHLNCHQKRHDLMLNIGIGNKNNEVADQTPTPTRFLRNCEEVGLFQDLQNVNPFDETFKKALCKDSLLSIPVPSTDDTLHTPHILPYIQENDCKYDHNENISCPSNDFALSNVIPQQSIEKNIPVICIEEEKSLDSSINVKTKIKEVILKNLKDTGNKDCSNVQNPIFNLVERPVDNHTSDSNREKIREMNRAAQHRCRIRKQMQKKKSEQEMILLKNENKRLLMENTSLKSENMKLKEMLIQYESKLNQSNIAVDNQSINNDASVVVQIISSPNGNVCVPIISSLTNNDLKNNSAIATPLSSITSDCKSVVLLQNPKHRNKRFRKIIPKTKI